MYTIYGRRIDKDNYYQAPDQVYTRAEKAGRTITKWGQVSVSIH